MFAKKENELNEALNYTRRMRNYFLNSCVCVFLFYLPRQKVNASWGLIQFTTSVVPPFPPPSILISDT